MVRITIVGREVAPVNYPENSNADAVERKLIVAFGPGLLMRAGEGVVSESLSGDYDFHITGATGAGAVGISEERLEAIIINTVQPMLTTAVEPLYKAFSFAIGEGLDPWETILSETSSVVASNETANLEQVSTFYGIRKSKYCMVLGNVTHCHVICAHIWPRWTYGKGLEAFELNDLDVNSHRNFLRLHNAIKQAFDKKRLIFVPSESSAEGWIALKVVILDPALFHEDISFNNSTVKFSSISNRVFDYKFTAEKSPFTRLISNHAWQARKKAKVLGWISIDDEKEIIAATRARASKSLGEQSYIMQLFLK